MRLTQRQMAQGIRAGLTRLRTQDENFEDPFITVNNKRLVDFGSCSYLGLNRDPRLIEAAQEAVARFGTSHSSSTMYTSIGLYGELEQRLERMLGATVAVAPTTTLAHLAALPVLAGPGDLVIVDKQAHASLHLAATVLQGNGTEVVLSEHNDMAALRRKLADANIYNKIWYVADGLYSMHGDFAPVAELNELLGDFEKLHLYMDDAHAFSWKGDAGAGHTLSAMDWSDRLVVAAGFAKSFGTTGALLAFGSPDLAERVLLCGPPFTFSGPLQPATLGASIASADIHLSAEHAQRQTELMRRIELARKLLIEHGLPVADLSATPIWFVRVGSVDDVLDTMRKLMDDGFYVNPSAYPAVPLGDGGIRFTQTLHQSEEQLRSLIEAMARHIPTEPYVSIDLAEYEAADAGAAGNGRRSQLEQQATT
jgi:7-keto-8-aminopelargonate synthetase-like enzyme